MKFWSRIKDVLTSDEKIVSAFDFNHCSTFGWTCGSDPDPSQIERTAQLLNRSTRFVDDDSYQREIFAASINEQSGAVAFFEWRAKQLRDKVDVSIKFHLHSRDGRNLNWDIESYNPYSGCDVRYMKWFDDSVVSIYREKHHNYICRATWNDQPEFKRIGEYWKVNNDLLAFRQNEKGSMICLLSLPDLTEQPAISQTDAEQLGLFPESAILLPSTSI